MNNNNFSHDNGFNVSSRYAVINTGSIVSQFEAAGFQLHRQSAARVKDQARQGFQRHLMVFRHPTMQLKNINDSVPEILLKNSYDGTSSFQLMLGIYRMVCANGLVVGSTYSVARVKHVGNNALQKAIDNAFQVAGQVGQAADAISRMQSVQLTDGQANQFASEAWALIAPPSAVAYDVRSLLRARRGPDTAMDLWTVYNRVQENIIRGGVQYQTVNELGQVRNATRRGVKAIDANLSINKALWTVAETMLQRA